MKRIINWKFLAVILILAVLSIGAASSVKNKAASLRGIQLQQAVPLGINAPLPPGPRTGKFYLNSGFSNGIHDLGRFNKDQRLTIFVESLTTGFDPTVLITAPNWAQQDLIVWQADDNGSDPDPAFTLTIPVTGVYTMLVAEYSGRAGWYRYRMEVD